MPDVKRGLKISIAFMVAGIFFGLIAMIMLMTRPAWPAEITPPPAYSCDDVRRLIAEKGKVAAIAFAVEHGLSLRQIWQIRRTCKV